VRNPLRVVLGSLVQRAALC